MKIKGLLKDLSGISRIKKNREIAINSNNGDIKEDSINKMANLLHPGKQIAKVINITKETSDSVRIRFGLDMVPLFKAGTYLTIELNIDGSRVSRAYSVITSPLKAYKDKYVEIIVKDYPHGFVSSYLNHSLKVNDAVILEIGLGQFGYERIRDNPHLVAIAGGAGITPFIAMAHDIIDKNLSLDLTIIYGSDNPKEIIAYDELESLRRDNIKIIYVISGNYPYDGEKGFINKDIIKKYAPNNATYYFSGPRVMYDHLLDEFKQLDIDIRRIRKEAFPVSNVRLIKNYPLDNINKTFNILVKQGIYETNIVARGDESIATALERAGLKIHTACRSGECGFCRIHVLEGTYFIPQEMDKRRYTDKEYNWVHACSTYPTSNLTIKINI